MQAKLKPGRKYAHVLRPLLEQEKQALRGQLKQYGLLHDLTLDQHGDLLDGHSREELCNELGISLRYRTVTTNDPVGWIKSMQKARRNLDRDEMRKLIAEQIVATPHMSNNAVAKAVGVSDMTVAKVRTGLIAKGKVSNVVRFDTKGRVAGGNKQRHSQVGSVNLSESSQPVVSDESKKAMYGEPPVLRLENGKLKGLTQSVIYHFADTGAFYSAARMIAMLDPDGKLGLTEIKFQKLAFDLKDRKDIYLETRPGPGQTKHYRYYRQDKTIGLSVLRAKFNPVIEDLKAQAALPISHQSTGRFLAAAGVLIQLLRDLEVE